MATRKIVSWDKASDEQVQRAARFLGLDEVSSRFFNAIDDPQLQPDDRKLLVNRMKRDYPNGVDDTNEGFTCPAGFK